MKFQKKSIIKHHHLYFLILESVQVHKEINTNKYDGSGIIGDYASETATLKITQPLLRIYFFDELNKAEANINRSQIEISSYKKDLIIKSAELYFSLINSNNNIRLS